MHLPLFAIATEVIELAVSIQSIVTLLLDMALIFVL